MNNRIKSAFDGVKAENRTALVTYTMACDPDPATSLQIMQEMAENGADIIELGIPFSDPMADGPTIQEAAIRALNAGCNMREVFDIARKFRTHNQNTPIILMGYYNPIYRYGIDKFVKDAVEIGIDGVIIVDLPPEEEGEFTDIATPAGLSLIKLTAPTTDKQRAEKILQNATGFVYHISVAGVTGQKKPDISIIEKKLNLLQKATDLPIVVGFGIKTPEQAAKIASAKNISGIVVGSAFVRLIQENSPKKSVEAISGLTKSISDALSGTN